MSLSGYAVFIVRDKYDQPQNVIAANAVHAWSKPCNWDVVDYFGDEPTAARCREQLVQDLFPAADY